METFRELAKQIEEQLRVQTYPLALKLLKSADEIPEGAKRPRRDLGYRLSTCQCFAMSRRQGIVVAQLKEDMWCPEPVIGYGMEEPPAFFLEGHNRFPRDVETLEAGAAWAAGEFPRLDEGVNRGIVSAPLAEAPFDPDVIVIYCNTAQLTLLLLAAAYKDGKDVPSTVSSHAACVYAVVPPIQKGGYWVSIPCMGDRARAMARDDEIIFSLLPGAAGDLLKGLRHIEEGGRRIPFEIGTVPEYELSEPYGRMARELGMID